MVKFNPNINYEILLASASPRRQKLLRGLNIPFKLVKAPDINETIDKNLYKENIAINLAEQKANSYKGLLDNQLLITADTIVWIDDKVLGKPDDYSDAFQMLKLLSGKPHYVITGVCLKTNNKTKLFHAETLVKFSKLEDDEIRFYIEQYKPYDKAGAYGIQEWIGKIGIEHIEGSFYNVMGLPVHKLYKELLAF
ncbi:MAG: Maf family nucleotide pyrophosphatase [Bacteroidales bacterium]|jgi:septum formation protein|nr:Maf family nucleotide pyrophosphatase [Bacteroidales bacterium]MDY0143001.1 Maf family nucleotide pyrophosphatase [Bacteroidales bacterium]